MKRVVLAYSGGLDTSVAVRWLGEELGVEVIALAADVGQGGDFDEIRERALAAGAVEAIVVDCRDEFARDFVAPALKANAKYEGKYPLVSALSRPLIAKHMVAVAREHGADAVAHGCTGKGNDQVRFEVSTRALAPDLEVIAPVRGWGLTREQSIEYAQRYAIPITVTKKSPYSIDQNLWGRTIECGILEDPWEQPPEEVYELTTPTATEPTELVVPFEQGVPVAIDGRAMPLHELVNEVTRVVGSYGWGRIDMVENRRVGIKSREVYECPGALALLMAHADLEDLTLERDLAHEKARLEPRYADLVYDGLWFSPLKQALDAFVDESQRFVTGDVRLRCEVPGRCLAVGRRSEVEPLRLRPGHLRERRPLPPRPLRGLRTAVGARRRDVGRAPGTARRATVTLWQGRFGDEPAEELLAFTSSLSFDLRLAPDDLAGSRAHVRGLERGGVITHDEVGIVLTALDRVEEELAQGTFKFGPGDEDVHTAIERRVTELAGAAGAKLHTGRSRNDQVATDLRLFTKRAVVDVAHGVVALQRVLHDRAKAAMQADIHLPGYTHMQRAQPVPLAHHLLAHAWALARDVDRLLDTRVRLDVSPLGAGALAGSSLPLDPDGVARRSRVCPTLRELHRRGRRSRLRRRGVVRPRTARCASESHR